MQSTPISRYLATQPLAWLDGLQKQDSGVTKPESTVSKQMSDTHLDLIDAFYPFEKRDLSRSSFTSLESYREMVRNISHLPSTDQVSCTSRNLIGMDFAELEERALAQLSSKTFSQLLELDHISTRSRYSELPSVLKTQTSSVNTTRSTHGSMAMQAVLKESHKCTDFSASRQTVTTSKPNSIQNTTQLPKSNPYCLKLEYAKYMDWAWTNITELPL